MHSNHFTIKLICFFLKDVRWLSLGQSMARLSELQNAVEELIKEKTGTRAGRFNAMIDDSEFWCFVAYLADVYSLLNKFCLQIQGGQKNAFAVIL